MFINIAYYNKMDSEFYILLLFSVFPFITSHDREWDSMPPGFGEYNGTLEPNYFNFDRYLGKHQSHLFTKSSFLLNTSLLVTFENLLIENFQPYSTFLSNINVKANSNYSGCKLSISLHVCTTRYFPF